MRSLDRLTLLNAIFSHLQRATQWPGGGETGRCIDRAEAIIEVLEAFDCGSHGGHDPTNPHRRVTGCNVFDRFLTLLRKHQDAGKIKASCGADVDTLAYYFTELAALRSKVYQEHPAGG